MSRPSEVPSEVALLAGLAAHAVELEKTAKELRTAYRFSRQLKAILVLGGLLIGGLVWIALLNLSNGAAIRSCTTPTGACYRDSQQRTAAAVTQIVSAINAHTNVVLIATLECSGRRTTSRQLARCLRSKGIR